MNRELFQYPQSACMNVTIADLEIIHISIAGGDISKTIPSDSRSSHNSFDSANMTGIISSVMSEIDSQGLWKTATASADESDILQNMNRAPNIGRFIRH